VSYLFSRKPSALEPLDGMRAFAFLWVFLIHTLSQNPAYQACFRTNDTLMTFIVWILHGDLAVDMFFVLSGFLITYSLLKEGSRNGGEVGIISFFRNRLLRLWPAMIFWCLTEFFIKVNFKNFSMRVLFFGGDWKNALYDLATILSFTSNIMHVPSHLWTVCVEWHAYLITPFVVNRMLKSKSNGYLKWPVLLLILSLILNFGMNAYLCPGLLEGKNVEKECQMRILFKIYLQSYTRIGPYLLGMISAYWVINPEAAPERYALGELVCLGGVLTISYVGAWGVFYNFIAEDGKQMLPGVPLYFYKSLVRVVFGACWCYLLPGFLTKDHIPAYRATLYCRSFLGSYFWVFFANISFSGYIWHMIVLGVFQPRDALNAKAAGSAMDNLAGNDTYAADVCGEGGIFEAGKSYMEFVFTSFAVTAAIASLSVIFLERPFIMSRQAFNEPLANSAPLIKKEPILQ